MVSTEYNSLVLGNVLCPYNFDLFEENVHKHPIFDSRLILVLLDKDADKAIY